MHNRALIVLMAIVPAAVVAPALAQDAAAPAGRFQLAPGDGSSFVRLDTRTGAVSHCSQDAGVWRCEPIVDSGLLDRLGALSGKVDGLSARVDGLSARLDSLSLRVDSLAATAASPPAARPGEGAGHQPVSLARTMVDRLLDMIRTLKHGRAAQT